MVFPRYFYNFGKHRNIFLGKIQHLIFVKMCNEKFENLLMIEKVLPKGKFASIGTCTL